MFRRPTSLAAAFVNAALVLEKDKKVDHTHGQGSWVARRVLLNAEKPNFGIVTEVDRRPVKA